MRVAYVVSRYPAVSHTFILREVMGLRRLGWEVVTVSVRGARAGDLLTEVDRAEAASTKVIVRGGVGGALRAVGAVVGGFLRSPAGFCRGVGCAWKLRRAGVKGHVWAGFYFVEALLLRRICVREGVGHVHAHFANVASDVAMIAAAIGRTGFSFTMHGPTEFFEVGGHKLREKAEAAGAVICISDFARSQMMAVTRMEEWGKLKVVHCGVDPEQFAGERLRASEGGGGAIEVLCVARMTEVKGHGVLLGAVAGLVKGGRDVRVTLAGDGPLRGELERRARELGLNGAGRERVTFLGNVGQDVMAGLYRAADVFVLASFAEGVPVVLMEAMASGCAVVATRIAGIPELLGEGFSCGGGGGGPGKVELEAAKMGGEKMGSNIVSGKMMFDPVLEKRMFDPLFGIMVAAGRVDEVAAAIGWVADHPVEAVAMAERGREKVRREFNIHAVAPQVAAVLRGVMKGEAAAEGTKVAGQAVVEGGAS